MICAKCVKFAARFRCNKPDECDCPKCQGFCTCSATSTADPQFAKLIEDIYEVWQAIGPDVESVTRVNEERIEMCVDADHLTLTIKAPDSQAYLRTLIDKHTYPKVLTLLSKHLQL